MKKNTLILLTSICLFITAPAFAADGIALPDQWPAPLKAGTVDMIHAGVEPENAIAMTSAMIQAAFKENLARAAQQMVVTAQKQGLPLSPIMGKVREGIAKRVAPERIVQAMERVKSRYEYSFAQAGKLVAGSREKQQLGQTIAAGMAAGLQTREVEAMIQTLSTTTAGMSSSEMTALAAQMLETARDMARRGVSSNDAAQAALQTMNRNRGNARQGSGPAGNKGSGSGQGTGPGGSGDNGSGGSGSSGSGGGSGNGPGGGSGGGSGNGSGGGGNSGGSGKR